MYLGFVLYPYLAQTRLGRVFPELRCIFGPPEAPRTYVPDLAVVAREYLPVRRHLLAAPLVAIEILSPDQRWPEFLSKVQFYLLNGVRLVWIIDPDTSTITVQKPGEEAIVLSTGDTLDGSDVLPGFSMNVDEIFAEAEQP
jgi:Uma2 family endonuclease